MGFADPLPWYLAYFQAADRCNCSPWELMDEPMSRLFWLRSAQVINSAEAEVQRRKMEEHQKKR